MSNLVMGLRRALGRAAIPTAIAIPWAASAQSSPPPADVDRIFAAYDKPTSPGCALGVSRDGRLVYEHGYGSAELEWNIPITTTTVFNVGSISKEFVAASIALLAERGKLSLDDDVRKYIPELPRYEATITLRQLLHHTSGVRDLLELMVLAGKDINTHYRTEEYVELLARQKELNFPPGSQYLYSNSGYLLLGVVVQRVSGMSLRDFAERNIFGPLGMKDTHIHDDNRMIIARRAEAYSPAPGGAGFVLEYSTNFDRVGPGGVNTTVRDMALWDHSFDTGTLGGPEFRRTMLTRGMLTSGDSIPYALGLQHGEEGGLRTISHGGSSLGFRAHYLRFPDQHVSIFVLCNTPINPARLATQVAQAYLGTAMKAQATRTSAAAPATAPAEVALPAAELQNFTGQYWSEEIGVRYDVVAKGGGLVVKRFGFQEIPIVSIGGNRFRSPVGTLEFQRTNGGSASEFRLSGGRMKNLLFKRTGG